MPVGLDNRARGPTARWRPLPPGSVRIGTGFWRQRQRSNRGAELRHGPARGCGHGHRCGLRSGSLGLGAAALPHGGPGAEPQAAPGPQAMTVRIPRAPQ